MSLPKPYYSEDGITIYHADCRAILPDLEPVDLVLTDPPYGIGLANHDTTRKTNRSGTWSVVGDDSTVGQEVIDFCFERKFPLVAFASPKARWRGSWRQELIWDKGEAVGGGGDISTTWKMTHELILYAGTGTLCGSRTGSVLSFPVTQSQFPLHPTEKPVALCVYLLGRFAPTTVLDPFMGSGTTLVAAKLDNRKGVGIEIEERYCEIAANRLRQGVLDFG